MAQILILVCKYAANIEMYLATRHTKFPSHQNNENQQYMTPPRQERAIIILIITVIIVIISEVHIGGTYVITVIITVSSVWSFRFCIVSSHNLFN